MIRQETLLPGTRALSRGNIEVSRYHGKILVRYRDLEGYTSQQKFHDPDLAHSHFLSCMIALRAQLQKQTGGTT